MAWIRAYSTLKDHPKLKKLARLLEISAPEAIGHLMCLWWWVLDYAPDGDVTGFDEETIAEAGRWEGDPRKFYVSLTECGCKNYAGFLEKTEKKEGEKVLIHDWEEAQGSEYKKRVKAAEYMRKCREKKRDTNVSLTLDQRDTNVSLTECGCKNYAGFLEKTEKKEEKKEGEKEEKEGEKILIHDWEEAQGSEYKKRVKADEYTEYMRKCREKKRDTNVRLTLDQRYAHVRGEKRREEKRRKNTPPAPPEGGVGGEAAAEAQHTRQKFQELVDAWNAVLPPIGFPKVIKPTPARIKAFAARMNASKERCEAEWWTRNVIKTIAGSDFMKREARKGANWLTLDWVLNENNLVKILEGKYSGGKGYHGFSDAWENINTDYDSAMRQLHGDFVDAEVICDDETGLRGVLPDASEGGGNNNGAEREDARKNVSCAV